MQNMWKPRIQNQQWKTLVNRKISQRTSASRSQDKERRKPGWRQTPMLLLKLLSSGTILIYSYKPLLAAYGGWKKPCSKGYSKMSGFNDRPFVRLVKNKYWGFLMWIQTVWRTAIANFQPRHMEPWEYMWNYVTMSSCGERVWNFS